jgi:ubiquinone/menaquinone biosynthesis C-methylase UbiE
VRPHDDDKVFSGSVAELYETHMVPLLFQPYADDLASRLAAQQPQRVLEIAAGTGVVTRALDDVLPESTTIVATDLNQAMLDQGAARGTGRAVEWRQADAQQLPFDDASFDVVVCQFGAMFFPDKPKAYSEARRVLTPGGVYVFNVWDRIEDNEFAAIATDAMAALFPDDPPRFLARTPHGYHDLAAIQRDLAKGGFSAAPDVITLAARSRAADSHFPAVAYCQGSPLRNEIEARDPEGLARATDAAEQAIEARFGPGAVDGKIQAIVVTVERD